MKFRFEIIFIVILVVFLVVLTGCSQNEENIPSNTELDQSEEDLESSNPEEEGEEPVEEVEESQESESKDDEEISDVMTDSGTYVGQVDNNHIEIKISGVPLEIASKVFIADEDIKSTIEEEIKEEDQVKFEYYLNEDDVGVIVDIEKIVN